MQKILLLLLLVLVAVPSLGARSCKPEITVLNGLAANVGPVDVNGDDISDLVGVEMQLSDFLIGAKSPCNNGPLTLTLTKSFDFAPGNSTKVFFNLTELGIQIVKIWAVDATGSSDYVETYVLVQDNLNWELQPPVSTGCSPDLVPPTVVMVNGLASTFIPNGNGTASVQVLSVQMLRRYADNCDTVQTSKPRVNKATQPTSTPPIAGVSTFSCQDELGFSLVSLWMKDAAGNFSLTESYILGQNGLIDYCDNNIEKGCTPDQIPPALFVYNGLTVNIQTPNGREVSVDEFIQKVTDNCGAVSDARIRRSSGSIFPPMTTKVTFDCTSLGTQQVEIWIADQAGNWIRTETHAHVQDNTGGCGNAPRLNGREGKPWPEWKEGLGKGW